MPITTIEIADLAFSAKDPSTLGELLIAGKKLPPDATALLGQDHDEVAAMFRQYEKEGDGTIKANIADKICTALAVHARIEEEVFYPAAGQVSENDEPLNKAVEEHSEMKEVIAAVVGNKGKSPDRHLKKLVRMVERHVQEEETEMFPDMRQANVDLFELGRRLAARRSEALLGLRRARLEAY